LLTVAALAVLGAAPAGADQLKRLERAPDTTCARYGPGFAPVAGTTTCVRVAGRVRAEAEAVRARGQEIGGVGATGRVSVDARTDTNLGPARAFVRFGNGRVTGADRAP
jgi:hypothetical protein